MSEVNIDEIRQRVLQSTEGRESETYSVFEVTGHVHVGDIGASWYGDVEVPFDALAIGGPTHSKYNDHVLALIPKTHGDAEANAELFANARSDILALLNEVERLMDKEDA